MLVALKVCILLTVQWSKLQSQCACSSHSPCVFSFHSPLYSLWTGCYSLFTFKSNFLKKIQGSSVRCGIIGWLWKAKCTFLDVFFLGRRIHAGPENIQLFVDLSAWDSWSRANQLHTHTKRAPSSFWNKRRPMREKNSMQLCGHLNAWSHTDQRKRRWERVHSTADIIQSLVNR